MNKKEKEILEKVMKSEKGLLSPSEIDYIANRDKKSVNILVTKGYIEEVKTNKNGQIYNFCRVTEKGIVYFDKWYKKLFLNIKGDVRSIIVSFLTTFVTYILIKIFFKN